MDQAPCGTDLTRRRLTCDVTVAYITCSFLPGLLSVIRTASDNSCGGGLGTDYCGYARKNQKIHELKEEYWLVYLIL